MKPGSKSRLTSKTTNLSKELNENLLSEVFCFRNISGHTQAETIHAAIMTLVQILESAHIALGRLLRQLIVCRLRCLRFGSGHVSSARASWKKSHNFRGLFGTISRFSLFQGSGTRARNLHAGL